MARLLAGWPLEMREGPHGRYCVTSQAVRGGELVLSAVPFAVALEPEQCEFVCFGCGKTAHTPLPLRCEECKGVRFCSAECRGGVGGERHRPVCGWEAPFLATLRKLDARRKEQLCVESHEETTLRLLLATVLTHAEAEADTEDVGRPRTRVRGQSTYADVLRQCAHEEVLDPRVKALGELAHAAMAKILPPHVTPGVDEVVGLLAREECNGFAVWSREYDRLAASIAPGAALVNHSCGPSAAKVTGTGFNVELRALRDLSAGEEVTISYVPLCEPMAGRQALLRHHFNFICACHRCEAETATGVNEPPAQAHDCGGVLYPAIARGRMLRNMPVMRCSICARDVPIKSKGTPTKPPSAAVVKPAAAERVHDAPLEKAKPQEPQEQEPQAQNPAPQPQPAAAAPSVAGSSRATPSMVSRLMRRMVTRGDDHSEQQPRKPAPSPLPPFAALNAANATIEEARTISELDDEYDVANLDSLADWDEEDDEDETRD